MYAKISAKINMPTFLFFGRRYLTTFRFFFLAINNFLSAYPCLIPGRFALRAFAVPAFSYYK